MYRTEWTFKVSLKWRARDAQVCSFNSVHTIHMSKLQYFLWNSVSIQKNYMYVKMVIRTNFCTVFQQYTADVSGLLGCDIVSLNEWFLMLHRIINTPSKAQNHSPNNLAPQPTKLKSHQLSCVNHKSYNLHSCSKDTTYKLY